MNEIVRRKKRVTDESYFVIIECICDNDVTTQPRVSGAAPVNNNRLLEKKYLAFYRVRGVDVDAGRPMDAVDGANVADVAEPCGV
jgi:hypothetical protein